MRCVWVYRKHYRNVIEIYKTLQSVKSVVLKYAMENELFWILIEWRTSNSFSQFTVFKILKNAHGNKTKLGSTCLNIQCNNEFKKFLS